MRLEILVTREITCEDEIAYLNKLTSTELEEELTTMEAGVLGDLCFEEGGKCSIKLIR